MLKFADIVEINPTVPLTKGEEYQHIPMENITPGQRYVSATARRIYTGGGSKFKDGDTLFARITPCLENGKIAQFKPTEHSYGFGSTEFFVFRNKSGFSDPAFVYYLAQTDLIRKPAEKSMVGASGRQRADLNVIKEIVVPDIPLPTQQKIAAILSAYDDLIENNNRRIKILEEMARLIYKEWFVNFRFPGHENVKMIDSPLGEIPEGWEVKKLINVCNRITDGSHSSPNSVEIGYPMASVKDMSNWGFNLDTCRQISKEDFIKLVANDCKPLIGDVLIAKDGSYLKHVFVIEEDQKMVILSSIAILRPNIESVLPYYLCFVLREPDIKTRLSNYVSGAALPRIILKDFANFMIVIPQMSTQQQFNSYIEPMIKSIHTLLKKNSKLRQTRDLLLPKLISGELDVSDLNIDIGDDAA